MLASLSKLFTALATAQLVERGRLAFDTPMFNVLPDYPRPDIARRITVAHLLTHTSGLPDFYRNGKFRQYEDSLRTLNDFWVMFANDSLWSTPGTRYDYSNSNYIVLGSIVERLTGLSFEEYVTRNVFGPSGMTRTCYCEVGADNRATPYSRYTAGFGPTRRSVPDRWVEVPSSARRPGAPAGGGISTVGDLARFAAKRAPGSVSRSPLFHGPWAFMPRTLHGAATCLASAGHPPLRNRSRASNTNSGLSIHGMCAASRTVSRRALGSRETHSRPAP